MRTLCLVHLWMKLLPRQTWLGSENIVCSHVVLANISQSGSWLTEVDQGQGCQVRQTSQGATWPGHCHQIRWLFSHLTCPCSSAVEWCRYRSITKTISCHTLDSVLLNITDVKVNSRMGRLTDSLVLTNCVVTMVKDQLPGIHRWYL